MMVAWPYSVHIGGGESGQILDVVPMLMLSENRPKKKTCCLTPLITNTRNYKSIYSNRRLFGDRQERGGKDYKGA